MSNKCELTGKGPLKGHNVSHANNKTKRKFNPSVKKIRFKSDILKKNVTLKVSNAALRTVDFKGGIDKFLTSAKAYKLSKRAKKLRNKIVLKEEFKRINPNYIIHLAARTDLSGKSIDDYSSNTIGTKNLIDLSILYKPKF